MVLLSGPRQVGKTTLARSLLEVRGAGAYFSWDSRRDRRRLLASEWPSPPGLLVFDELHKYLSYFGKRLRIPHLYQVVASTRRDFVRHEIRVMPAFRFLPAVA